MLLTNNSSTQHLGGDRCTRLYWRTTSPLAHRSASVRDPRLRGQGGDRSGCGYDGTLTKRRWACPLDFGAKTPRVTEAPPSAMVARASAKDDDAMVWRAPHPPGYAAQAFAGSAIALYSRQCNHRDAWRASLRQQERRHAFRTEHPAVPYAPSAIVPANTIALIGVPAYGRISPTTFMRRASHRP